MKEFFVSAPYSIPYHFNPNDIIWVLNGNAINKGTCIQVNIKIVPSSVTTFDNQIEYIVLFDCNNGTKIVSESNCFPTLQDAMNALQFNMVNSSC